MDSTEKNRLIHFHWFDKVFPPKTHESAPHEPIRPKYIDPMDKLAQDWLKKEGELDVSGYTFDQLMRDY